MSKLVVVTGATGQQGGGLIKALLKAGNFKIRAVTRNTTSDKAKALAAQDIEVVAANFDDVESLKVAFKGEHSMTCSPNGTIWNNS